MNQSKVLLFSCLFLCACSQQKENTSKNNSASSTPQAPTKTVTSIGFKKGVWNCKNGDGSGMIFGENDSVFISLVGNQIQVLGTIQKDKKNGKTFEVFYQEPSELGLEGMEEDWDDFSKTIPIIKFERIDSATIVKKEWLGFYNTKTKKHEAALASDWDVCDTIVYYKDKLGD